MGTFLLNDVSLKVLGFDSFLRDQRDLEHNVLGVQPQSDFGRPFILKLPHADPFTFVCNSFMFRIEPKMEHSDSFYQLQ